MGMDTGDPCKWGPAPRNTSAPVMHDAASGSGSSPYVPADLQPYMDDIDYVVGKAKKAISGDTAPQVPPREREALHREIERT